MRNKKANRCALTVGAIKKVFPSNVHEQSLVFVVGRDPLGQAVRVPVKGIRVTMGPLGKPDIVELLT